MTCLLAGQGSRHRAMPAKAPAAKKKKAPAPASSSPQTSNRPAEDGNVQTDGTTLPHEVRAWTVVPDTQKLLPSSELEEQAHKLLAEAERVSNTSASRAMDNTFDRQLGQMLVRKKCKPKDLVLEWDKKGKGCIGKIEFRQGVRNLGLKVDNKTVDALFDMYDDDGGGTLDVPEVRCVLCSACACSAWPARQLVLRMWAVHA